MIHNDINISGALVSEYITSSHWSRIKQNKDVRY